MRTRTSILLLAAILAGGCGSTASLTPVTLASFPADIVLVVENRTETQVHLSPGLVDACGEATYTQAAIDAAVESFLDGTAPPPPAGVVDLTSISVAPPAGAKRPAVIVVTQQGGTVQFGPFDRAGLPACAGQAHRP
jgi:hypothetical protein